MYSNNPREVTVCRVFGLRNWTFLKPIEGNSYIFQFRRLADENTYVSTRKVLNTRERLVSQSNAPRKMFVIMREYNSI